VIIPRNMKIHKLIRYLTLLILLPLLLPGCGFFKGLTGEIEEPPQVLIEEGMRDLKAERYEAAAETFQELIDRHPYSRYAVLAELKMADALYLRQDYIEAVEAYKNFETLHPKNEAIPYIIFQQGMCYHRRMRSLDRDQTPALKAIQTFNRLRQAYPENKYAALAEARLVEAQNLLAGHEFYVGEYYFKKKKYRAALGRFVNLIKSFPDTGYHGPAMAYIKVCREKIAAEEEATLKKK